MESNALALEVFGVHSRLKFFFKKLVTTQGNHKGLPLHQNIFISLHKNISA
ncbi:MAG: hypothetical protein KAI83_11120 [Thiomargarita sp.]|nr:hypothetical protein [Thiomargarita sp.]